MTVEKIRKRSCGCVENITQYDDGSELIRTDFCDKPQSECDIRKGAKTSDTS